LTAKQERVTKLVMYCMHEVKSCHWHRCHNTPPCWRYT